MGRKNLIACVYMLRNKKTNKIYIGETSNYVDRMSSYKSTKRKLSQHQIHPRPIDIAIGKYGWNNFESIVLVKKNMQDVTNRRAVETKLIRAFRSTDPAIGYNVTEVNSAKSFGKRASKPTPISTKILKSNPLISYEISTGEMFIWVGSKSFADELGCSRAQVARSAKNGKAIHGYYIFALDPKLRKINAESIILSKTNATSRNKLASQTLAKYKKAYKNVNEYSKKWGIK